MVNAKVAEEEVLELLLEMKEEEEEEGRLVKLRDLEGEWEEEEWRM